MDGRRITAASLAEFPPAKTVVRLPQNDESPQGWIAKAWTFIQAMASKVTPTRIVGARLAVCRSCDHVDMRQGGMWCKKCVCSRGSDSTELHAKAMLDVATCPMRMWPGQQGQPESERLASIPADVAERSMVRSKGPDE